MLTRRAYLAGMGTAVLAGSTTGALAQAKPARIGFNGDFHGASVAAIGVSEGLWTKHGIEADLKLFTNGPLQIQALGAGSLDFGYVGPGAIWLPATGRGKIIAINALAFSDRLIAQPSFKAIADLRGKKVAVPDGSTGEMIVRLALAAAGMSVRDVELVKMDPSTLVAAFSSKQVDAAGIWYPLIGTIRRNVPDLNELAKDADFAATTSFPSAFVVRNEIVEKDPDLIRRMVRAIKEAQDFRAAEVARSVEITAKRLGIPPDALKTEAENGGLLTSAELVRLTKDGTVRKWLDALSQMFIEFGRFEKPLPVDDYYLSTFYAP